MTLWQEFPWERDEPEPSRDRLCTPGTPWTRPTQLDCRLEGADFTLGPPDPKDEIVVCAYNVERGMRLDGQLRAFAGGGVPTADVLLISEADRGCGRSGDRNVAREYARVLGMCYVYGVEFVELPRRWGPGGRMRRRCEHGNTIVSRYPLGNVRLIRHRRTRSWHSPLQRVLHVGQPRLGGRVALGADVLVGDRMLRVYSVHLESGRLAIGPRRRDVFRQAQIEEVIADASEVPGGVVIGGDMNVVRYLQSTGDGREPTTDALVRAGFEDAHALHPPDTRITTDSGVVIDLIVGRNVRFVESGVGATGPWADLSDHRPVWARVGL